MRQAEPSYDLYVWKAPRDLDAERAASVLRDWHARGADPAASPFEPSTDVGWFHRELTQDEPGLEVTSDAVPNPTRTPIWLSSTDEPPARLVAMRLPAAIRRDALDSIFGLAAKYDLVLFDARRGAVHLPLEALAAYASATFWNRGAIQAAVAGGIGLAAAIGAWLLGIPLLSGLVAIVGVFMFAMAVYSFVHEGRKTLSARRRNGSKPPDG